MKRPPATRTIECAEPCRPTALRTQFRADGPAGTRRRRDVSWRVVSPRRGTHRPDGARRRRNGHFPIGSLAALSCRDRCACRRRAGSSKSASPSPERSAFAAASACSLIASCAVSRPAPCFTASIRIVVVARKGRLRSFSAAIAAGKTSICRSTVRIGFERAIDGEKRVRQRHAPNHRAGDVAFIPLMAGQRAGHRHVSAENRGEAADALAVPRVDLVRHGGRADLAFLKAFGEQARRPPSAEAWSRSSLRPRRVGASARDDFEIESARINLADRDQARRGSPDACSTRVSS